MPARGSPKTRSTPEDGFSRPAATLSSVDLPQPVGPTTETNSPSPIVSDTSFTAVYDPALPREAKVQVMRSNSTAEVVTVFFGVERRAPSVRTTFSLPASAPCRLFVLRGGLARERVV